jgi:hypothetical protein
MFMAEKLWIMLLWIVVMLSLVHTTRRHNPLDYDTQHEGF